MAENIYHLADEMADLPRTIHVHEHRIKRALQARIKDLLQAQAVPEQDALCDA